MHKINLDEAEDANFPVYSPSQIPVSISYIEPCMEYMGIKIGDKYQKLDDRPFKILAFGRLKNSRETVFITDHVTWAGINYLRSCTKLS